MRRAEAEDDPPMRIPPRRSPDPIAAPSLEYIPTIAPDVGPEVVVPSPAIWVILAVDERNPSLPPVRVDNAEETEPDQILPLAVIAAHDSVPATLPAAPVPIPTTPADTRETPASAVSNQLAVLLKKYPTPDPAKNPSVVSAVCELLS